MYARPLHGAAQHGMCVRMGIVYVEAASRLLRIITVYRLES